MKILLVSPSDLSKDSGVNKQVFNLSEALASLGDEVHIAAPNSTSRRFGDRTHSFFSLETGERADEITRSQVAGLLQREAFDIVHAHQPLAGSLAARALSLAGSAATVATFFGKDRPAAGRRQVWLERFLDRKSHQLLQRADRLIATSQSTQEEMSHTSRRPVALVPVGIDARRFSPAGRAPAHADGPLRVLFVGRWQDQERGFSQLLGALRQLAFGIPIELEVVGSESQPPDLEAGVVSVRFLGRVSDLRLPQLYRAADLVVAPALSKNVSGSALLEAMACGAAVVASDVGPYRELTAGSGAVLVPAGDPAALLSALQALAHRPFERALRGEANTMAAQSYRWDTLVHQVRQLYREAFVEKRGPNALEASAERPTFVARLTPPAPRAIGAWVASRR